MSNRRNIVSALSDLQRAVEAAEPALGIHVPENDDPDDIVESKQEGWDKDYGPKMKPVLLAIEQLRKAMAQGRNWPPSNPETLCCPSSSVASGASGARFDDVICINDPYVGRDLMRAAGDQPSDLWDRLWRKPSTDALLRAIVEHSPRVVITSSWLRFLQRDSMASLLHRTGLQVVAEYLHDVWEAPQDFGATRLQAIEAWLGKHYEGQSMVILDDAQSGTGLRGSKLDKIGCVVLCEVERGLGEQHLPIIGQALRDH